MKLDEDFLEYLRLGRKCEQANSATMMEYMVVLAFFSLLQYFFGMFVLPTIAAIGNISFLLICRKKFDEPYGNVLFVTGENVFYWYTFLSVGLGSLTYVEEGGRLCAIFISVFILHMIYVIYRIIFINKGGYAKLHYKKAKRNHWLLASPMIGLGIGRIWGSYLSNNAAFYVVGIGFIFAAFIYLVANFDGWIVYYYFKKLTPEEQRLVLYGDKKVKKERTVVAINKLKQED